MIATFNRGLLRSQTGDYRGAIQDYTSVIEQHPNFLTGYHYRSEARRKIGDLAGAEKDQFKLVQSQFAQNQQSTTNVGSDDISEDPEDKTRKKSDKNISNYRKIVIADDSENERQYKNDYRGRVQDRNVNIRLEPMYLLSYYEKPSEVKRPVSYHPSIDEFNSAKVFPKRLIITNQESPLNEEQIKYHFQLVDNHTSAILADAADPKAKFARALDFYLLQDFDSSISDLTNSILTDGQFYPSYFLRALVRCKQLEYQKATEVKSSARMDANEAREISSVDYDVVFADLQRVIDLAPDFVYAYYNRANLYAMLKDFRAALVDYDKAIELNPNFADAYFNRGLTNIFLGNNKKGIADLSKAGELGLYSAYNIIKRFTDYE